MNTLESFYIYNAKILDNQINDRCTKVIIVKILRVYPVFPH